MRSSPVVVKYRYSMAWYSEGTVKQRGVLCCSVLVRLSGVMWGKVQVKLCDVQLSGV